MSSPDPKTVRGRGRRDATGQQPPTTAAAAPATARTEASRAGDHWSTTFHALAWSEEDAAAEPNRYPGPADSRRGRPAPAHDPWFRRPQLLIAASAVALAALGSGGLAYLLAGGSTDSTVPPPPAWVQPDLNTAAGPPVAPPPAAPQPAAPPADAPVVQYQPPPVQAPPLAAPPPAPVQVPPPPVQNPPPAAPPPAAPPPADPPAQNPPKEDAPPADPPPASPPKKDPPAMKYCWFKQVAADQPCPLIPPGPDNWSHPCPGHPGYYEDNGGKCPTD